MLKWFQQVNHTPLCRRRQNALVLLPAWLGENSSLIPGLAIWYEPELVNKTCHPGFYKDATSALIHSSVLFPTKLYIFFRGTPFPLPISLLLSYVDGWYLTENDLFLCLSWVRERSLCFSYWVLLVGLICSSLLDGNLVAIEYVAAV